MKDTTVRQLVSEWMDDNISTTCRMLISKLTGLIRHLKDAQAEHDLIEALENYLEATK